MTRSRDLVWDGCLNVRDLGGHPTEDGRETRFRAVVRADSRAHLTDAGWEALLAYGVRRIVDLRRDDELADDPPLAAGLEVVHTSLMDGIEDGDEGWAEVVATAEAAPDVEGEYVVFYEAALERCRTTIGTALAAIADAPHGPVLVHCVGGKDRTGLVAALLLRLCGVPLADVDADYVATEANLRARHDEWIACAPDELERARRSQVASSPPGAMRRVLAGLEERHGSVDAYLAGSGITAPTRERLRVRLLG